MFTDAQSSVRHIEALLEMTQRLAASDIALYEHNYSFLDFGSWTIVAGKRKARVKFSWDGKDGFLTVEQASFSDSRELQKWEHVKTESIRVTQFSEALSAMETFLKQKFAD